MKRLLIACFALLAGCGAGDDGEKTATGAAQYCNADTAVHLPVATVPSISGYSGTWVKSPDQIVPISAYPNRFDSGYTSTPKVVYDDITQQYLTFYTGGVLIDQPGREMFGLATSSAPDAITTPYAGGGDRGSLFALGASGRYDTDRVWGMGTVMKDGGLWKAWVIGDGDATPEHVARVGYATSVDGRTWDKYDAATPTGAIFEDMSGCHANGVRGVLGFSVVKDTDGFYAWYYTFNSNQIRLAYSADGVNGWRTLGIVNLPVTVTGLGNVVKDGGVYYMTANTTDFGAVVVLASTDRNNWAIYDRIDVDGGTDWQSAWIGYPYLMRDPVNNDWLLYYTAADKRDDGLSGRIGVARLIAIPA